MYRKNKINEFFTAKAKKEGYPARSIYKLREIDEKYHLFRKGDKVLDLGCAPGSWLFYVSNKVESQGKVVGIDIKDIKIPLKENVIFIKKDIMDFEKSGAIELNQKYQAVISDLAPSTSGIESVDAGKSLELSKKAFDIAKKVLAPGGNFVCKIFEGEFTNDFFKKVGKSFKFTKRFRPKAVIKKSKEFYIIGIYFSIVG